MVMKVPLNIATDIEFQIIDGIITSIRLENSMYTVFTKSFLNSEPYSKDLLLSI